VPGATAGIAFTAVLAATAAVLVLLRGDFGLLVGLATYDADAAHLLAVPVLAAILVATRRRAIDRDAGRARVPGRWAGPPLVLLGVLLFAGGTWPFAFNQVRLLAAVPIVTGVVLATGGWRLLARLLPVLLLLALGIGVGTRYLIVLSAKPAAITVDLAAAILSRLPGATVTVVAGQLEFVRATGGQVVRGVVALGDVRIGATFVMAAISLAAVIVLARPRPFVRTATALVLAVPVIALANLLRVLVVGAWTIAWGASPLDAAPRFVGPAVMLAVTWLGVAAALWVARMLFPDADPVGADDLASAADERPPHGRLPRTAGLTLGLLAAFAVTTPVALGAIARAYEKEPIDLVRPFAALDVAALAPWTLDLEASPVSEAEEAWIGADEVFAATVEGGPVGAAVRAGTAMLLTYFADPGEAVTHTPEFCYLRAGCDILDRRLVPMPEEVADLLEEAVEVEIRTARDVRLVTYVFWHDGRAYHSRESLRFARGMPGDRHSYYAKVEVAQPFDPDAGPEARAAAAESSRRFLAALLRELSAEHFPET